MERRPLSAGVNPLAHADPEAVRKFIAPEAVKSPAISRSERSGPDVIDPARPRESRTVARPRPTGVTPVGLIPLTVRVRPEIAGALKRVSLERQLAGQVPYTQQDLVEAVLEPWLRTEGYLE